jgi:multisubunit Na+/H+ antiporter MnhE subunit
MRPTVEFVLWWLALTGLWVLTLAAPAVPELLAGAVAAGLGAVAAVYARRATRGSWRPRLSWLKWLAPVPGAALRESAAVLFRRPPAGTFEEVPLPAEPRPVHEARSAAAAVVVGCTPGTMVVASPPDDRRLVVHRLLPGPSPVLDRVRR